MNILYIIIPAYNEAENIEQTICQWYPIVEKYNANQQSRLVIIDDGSKDDTKHIVQQCMKNRPLLICLTKTNSGHGPTLLYGYQFAIQNQADYIFQTDSDGQTNPEEFDSFWQFRTQYDALLGNRIRRQDGLPRKIVQQIVLLLLFVIFGVRIPDANAPFRLMKTSLVKKYIHKLPSSFNLPNIMLTTYFAYFKENIRFLSISFKPRQGGLNSINLPKIFKIGVRAIKDFYQLRREIYIFPNDSSSFR